MSYGWYGVDLDGTLVEYDEETYDRYEVGTPVPDMMNRVKRWLMLGFEVRIFTARASVEDPEELQKVVDAINAFCLEHFGQELPVTCRKDFGLIELWDDRAVPVEFNTGRRLDGRDSRREGRMTVGDTVTRMLAGSVPMELKVTKVTDDLIVCGSWTFDRATGAEIDEELDWGPPPKGTGSYLREIVDARQ